MRRLAPVIALGLVIVAATPAVAATHVTVNQTEHIHGVFEEPMFGANPCSGAALVSFEATGNVVSHETAFLEDGQTTELWATFTETGRVSASDADGVTYSGRFTAWGNFNLNERNQNESFTLAFRLAGSDGSTLTGHEVTHFALNANGTATVDFDRMTLTCG